MQRLLVVENPASGVRFLRPSRSRIVQNLQRLKTDVTWIETRVETDEHLRACVRAGYDRILVIGGDGTIRHVAELLLAQDKRPPLALLPCGSGNVLATSLRVPLRPLERILDVAVHGTPHPIDVLRVNGTYACLLGAGQGYDRLFIEGAPRSLKQHLGALAYIVSFLRTFFITQADRFTIVVDAERHQVSAKLVLALNVLSPGGFPIHRSISPSDGWIDVFVFHPRTVWETLRIGMGLLLGHPQSAIPRLLSFRGKRVSIRQRKGRKIQIDGEIYPDKHLDIEILHGALSIVRR